jgi:hypothetical protein
MLYNVIIVKPISHVHVYFVPHVHTHVEPQTSFIMHTLNISGSLSLLLTTWSASTQIFSQKFSIE